jgi:hypothetical protein
VTGWEHAHEHGRGSALLASVEADWLQEDPDVMGDLRRLATDLATLDVTRDQYLVLRARLAGPDTFGYTPDDLDRAAEDYRAARRIVTDTDTGLAARLTEQERSGHRGGAGRAAERITSDQRREVEALAEVGHGHDRTASGADLRLGSQVEVVT